MVMSFKKSKAGGGGAGNYYVDCQSRSADDYYSNAPDAREPPGEWFIANGRKSFGISDQARFGLEDSAKFRALANGFDPRTSLALTQNSGAANRVALYDLTFSPPKSVSAAWSQADPVTKSGIEAAQRQACREALTFLSDKAGYTRRGKAGSQKEHVDLCGALFEHGSSRLGDPQLHTHGVILNVAERTDRSAGSIETMDLFRYIGAAASIYHSTLSTRLAELGFEIDKQDRLFELSAVPEEVNTEFSQRREAIENRAKEIAAETGMSIREVLSNQDLMQTAAMETRDQKGELTRSELAIQWRDRGEALGFGPQQVKTMLDPTRWTPLTHEQRELLTQQIPERLTQFSATFSEPQLYTAVAVELIGRGSREDIELAVAALRERCLAAERDGQLTFTTKEMVLLENQMLQTAGEKDTRHVIDSDSIERAISDSPTMTEEQADAVRQVLADEKRVSVLQGSAGAGKTFSLKTVANVYRENGYETHAIAAPWSAANVLRRETGMTSHRAIAGWLMDIESGAIELNSKSVIVVDEAGMVSAREMAKIVEAASTGGAKVVLTGDEKQLNSIGAGDALRTISRAYGGARIDEIQRQKNPDGSINTEHVEAIKAMFNGNSSLAMKAFESNIHLSSGAERTNRAMFEAWAISKESHPDQSHLMIAKRNADVAQLNQWAHERLKESGVIDTKQALSIRAIDSSKERPNIEFCRGDSVQFRKNQHRDLTIYNRTKATIESIDGPVMHLKTDEGQLVKMDTRDSLWFQERDLALQHTYAVTSYGSQGLSVGRTFVRDSVNLNRREAAVALSRHKSEVQVFSDRTEHADKIMQLADKMDWRPTAEISDQEIKSHIQKTWEYSPDKTSTLDFENWRDHEGQLFEPQIELEIDALQKASDAIRKARDSAKGSATFDFQMRSGYEISEEQLTTPATFRELKVKRDLQAAGISETAINRAEIQGSLKFCQIKNGEAKYGATFIGRDENSRAVSARTESLADYDRPQPAISAAGPLRHRHPAILAGDPTSRDIHIVRDGVQGLKIWTNHERAKKPLPTVIIAGDREDALVHRCTQERISQAQQVTFHKQPGSDLNVNDSTRSVERAQLTSVQEVSRAPVQIEQPTAEKASPQVDRSLGPQTNEQNYAVQPSIERTQQVNDANSITYERRVDDEERSR